MLVAQPSHASEEAHVHLLRVVDYKQTSTSAPSLSATLPYFFTSEANGIAAGIYDVMTTTLPTTGVFEASSNNYGGDTDDFGFQMKYQNLASFNTTFPIGSTYNLSMVPFSGSTVSIPLAILSLTLPSAMRVSNYTACQTITTTSAFTVTWDAIAGATANDQIFISVSSAKSGDDYTFLGSPDIGTSKALAGTTVSYIIPAKSLPPGVDLYAEVGFVRVDSKGISGGISYASGAGARTKLLFHTAGTVDTTAPLISSMSPSAGTTGVASTTSVIFSFNESMRSAAWSINYNGIGNIPNPSAEWLSLNKLRINAPASGWPKNTKITFTLNPDGFDASSSIRDLSGNVLVKKSVSITTGAL